MTSVNQILADLKKAQEAVFKSSHVPNVVIMPPQDFCGLLTISFIPDRFTYERWCTFSELYRMLARKYQRDEATQGDFVKLLNDFGQVEMDD